MQYYGHPFCGTISSCQTFPYSFVWENVDSEYSRYIFEDCPKQTQNWILYCF